MLVLAGFAVGTLAVPALAAAGVATAAPTVDAAAVNLRPGAIPDQVQRPVPPVPEQFPHDFGWQ